ncbi:hypothetical protein [uncultured Lutibacter sp.]|uniref:hypothetical protein n=1 Tax=uncultured Lutibacter sp. TaxID=437739 RepID=UPI00260C280D|nr:hypothetical protein [uncultured Lutibacter sp.]
MNTKIHNLSLQGISGILFGIISILFIALINELINQYTSSSGVTSVLPISIFEILILASVILFVLIAYFLIVFTNKRRRKKTNLKGWESNAKKIRLIFFIQFIILISVSYVCIELGMLKLIIPLILLLYGICCIISNHYTNGFSKILGFFFALQSMLAMFFPEVQFLLLSVAFGGFHIIYAILSRKNLV